MKRIIYSAIAFLLIGVAFSSCKKDKKNNNKYNLPGQVFTIVNSSIIDTLKKHGTVINEGTTPPKISASYLLHPYVCTYDGSGDGLAGYTFSDYIYTFSKENLSNNTIRVDYTDGPDDIGSDSTSTYISGSGNLFSVFSEASGVEAGVSYTTIAVFSGELTSTGIKNMQNSFYWKAKGADPNGVLVPVGTTRIFHDSDEFSELTNATIELNAAPKQKTLNLIKSLGLRAKTVSR